MIIKIGLKMPKFIVTVPIIQASGTQTFLVEADKLEQCIDLLKITKDPVIWDEDIKNYTRDYNNKIEPFVDWHTAGCSNLEQEEEENNKLKQTLHGNSYEK